MSHGGLYLFIAVFGLVMFHIDSRITEDGTQAKRWAEQFDKRIADVSRRDR
jgi:hypothetical protein